MMSSNRSEQLNSADDHKLELEVNDALFGLRIMSVVTMIPDNEELRHKMATKAFLQLSSTVREKVYAELSPRTLSRLGFFEKSAVQTEVTPDAEPVIKDDSSLSPRKST